MLKKKDRQNFKIAMFSGITAGLFSGSIVLTIQLILFEKGATLILGNIVIALLVLLIGVLSADTFLSNDKDFK